MSRVLSYLTLTTVAGLLIAPLHAIQDSNSNGLSDVWEKFYNSGNPFPLSSPYLAGDDPDADGWTNAQEAVAGTHPLSSALPEGWVRTTIQDHPEADGCFMLSWPSIDGKSYRLSVSTNLVDWADCGEVMAGTGNEIALALDCEYEEGGTPERMFWRVRIEDDDPDGDTLTSWEELALSLNPNHPDSDLDGIFDGVDSQPLSSATVADPDGLGLIASQEDGLIGRWFFESLDATGKLASTPESVGGIHIAASTALWDGHPLWTGGPTGMPSKCMHFQPPGLPSETQPTAYGKLPATQFSGWNTQTWSMWLQFPEDSLEGLAKKRTLFAMGAYEGAQDATQNPHIHCYIDPGTTSARHDDRLKIDTYWLSGDNFTQRNLASWPVPAGLDDGGWHHVAVSFGGGDYRFHLDAVQEGAATSNAVGINLVYSGGIPWCYLGTFKVEPQGSNNGLLVESWDSKTKTLDTSRTVLAVGASNVADVPEEFQENYERQRVVLLSLPTFSADRMFAASIHLPLGFEGLAFRIENTVTGHDFGTHHYLMGAPAGAGVEGPSAAKVYTSIHGMLGHEDADGIAVEDTRVWFMRSSDTGKPGRIEMYLVSPEHPVHGYGGIRITAQDGGTELGSIERNLTPDTEMAEVIDACTKVASGEGFDFCTDENWQLPGFGQGLALPEEWATPLLIPFLSAAYQIEGMTLVGTGIIEGVVNGFIDDCRLVEAVLNFGVVATNWAHQAVRTELQLWRDDPRTRLASLKNSTVGFFEDSICKASQQYVHKLGTIDGFKDALWDSLYLNPLTAPARFGQRLAAKHGAALTQSIWQSLEVWFDDFGNRMLEGAERNAWLNLPLDTGVLETGGTQLAREHAYTFGYTFGYLCEQVGVGVLAAGVTKYAQVAKVGGTVLAGQLASRTLGAIATRATLLKKWFASAAISIELRLAVEQGITVAGRTALPAAGNRVVLEVIEEGLESFGAQRSLMNWKVLLDDVLEQPRLLQVFQVAGYEAKYLESTAQLVHRLGATTTPQAMRQWPRLCNALAPLNEGAIANDVLRTGDFFTALKFDTPQGQQVVKELLESLESKTAAEILDGPALPTSIKNLYPTMYHYADRSTLIDFTDDLVDGVAGKWRLYQHQGNGRYVGVEDITPQVQVQSQFQLPLEKNGTTWTHDPNKGRFKCVSPTANDLVLPRADRHSVDTGSGAKSWLESLVKDNPNCGAGGQPQFKSWEEVIVEVYDTETGQLVRDKVHLLEILAE